MEKQKEIDWGLHRDYETLYDALWAKVPDKGSISGNKNKSLERFRKATQVIRDIFNNGLLNRGQSLKCLKLKKDDLILPQYHYGRLINPTQEEWQINEEIVWEAFKPILLDAVVEQLKGAN